MFKRYIFPFIAGQFLAFYTVSSMFDVSIGDTQFWEGNLKYLVYLLCALYTMLFSSMAHYCKQNDLRKKLEKENIDIKIEIEKLKSHQEIFNSETELNIGNSNYHPKTELQEIREIVEELRGKK